MEGAMLYRKFPAYNSNVSSAIPSDNLVRSMRSFTIPITTNFGLFSQMLKVTLETFLMRRVDDHEWSARPINDHISSIQHVHAALGAKKLRAFSKLSG